MEDIQEIKTFRRLSIIKWNSNKKSFFKSNEIPNLILKKKFIKKEGKKKIEKNIKLHNKLTDDESIKLINKKLNLFIKECKYLYNNTIPDSYWKFMGVIELAQFVNIGFTLIGLISRLWNLLSKIDGIKVNLKFQKLLIYHNGKMKVEIKNKTPNISKSEKDTENDIGELVDLSKVAEVEEVEEVEEAEKAIEKTNKPISVMDDIFGDMNTPKKKKKKSKKKSNNTIDDIFGF
jgi:ribonuclease MRP protein subunit RMP1